MYAKVCSLLDHSRAILISFKIVVIFNITSAEIKTKSDDVLLKMTTILKELRIAQCVLKINELYVKNCLDFLLKIFDLGNNF